MKALTPYKIGLAVMGLLTVTLFTVVLTQANSAKQDNKTNKAVTDIVSKLNDYISVGQQIPNDLAAAKIKDVPSSVSYKKISDMSYKFCVTYQSQASGYDGATNIVEDILYRGLNGGSYPAEPYYNDQVTSDDHSYLYAPQDYKKGENCQTITPYLYNPDGSVIGGAGNGSGPEPARSGVATISDPKEAALASGNQDSVCYQLNYTTHYSGVVSSVITADGKPIVPTVSSDLIIKVKPTGGTAKDKGEQVITLTRMSHNVYSSACTALAHESVKVGDHVSVFGDNTTQYSIDAIVDFSRNQ